MSDELRYTKCVIKLTLLEEEQAHDLNEPIDDGCRPELARTR